MASEEAFAQKPPRFTIQRHTHKPQGGGRQIASPTEKGGSAEELLPQKRYRAELMRQLPHIPVRIVSGDSPPNYNLPPRIIPKS